MDKPTKKLITDAIYAAAEYRQLTDFRAIYDMNIFFKKHGISVQTGDTTITVTQNGKPLAIAERRWSANRVALAYRPLKPAIAWQA